MPDIITRIGAVQGTSSISVMDTQSAYYRIPIAPQSIPKTACVTQGGEYVFKRLPFGIVDAPYIFSKLVDSTFSHF